ncbi:AAA family ATPase [Promicromonospora iranensis]|uniref:Chromosome partitioning protein n=1 Tax=Promicromonospora iranensis TaxID=1105144 RepID=A0ABU2CPW7_9MICO|nr:AAA family ATPase [Promicromonospora iranensis]MDR7383311.1 chromosome partitioning protein [Promicromonospora iranensis]
MAVLDERPARDVEATSQGTTDTSGEGPTEVDATADSRETPSSRASDPSSEDDEADGATGLTSDTTDDPPVDQATHAHEPEGAAASPGASPDGDPEDARSATAASGAVGETGSGEVTPAEAELSEPEDVTGKLEAGEDGTGVTRARADGTVDGAVLSSEDMALPQPEIVDGVPRDEVWGQDRPGHEGKSVGALSELIESVTMPAAENEAVDSDSEPTGVGASPMLEAASNRGPVEYGTAPVPSDTDPDEMEEVPSDRPVPADAIKRASEALDAAVNAAPAVLGPVSETDDDEAVALVDAEFTHFDGETEAESEPEDVASDYSGRVTDPIPVQSLSAPGVSRETSEPVQTPHGTQQPTGGPYGGDDERRSALIATVPAVDDTTPVAAELAIDARRRIELQGRRFPRPPKTRIITVANQKGGVGKTTTTVNVAAGLAQSGLNVLVIDNDPQGNASTALGIEHRAGTPSVYEILVEGESLASTVQQCPDIPNLWGVPATIDLSGSEIELVSLVSRETRLRKAIDKYLADRVAAGEERIDYVLIDCPPSLGLLTVNAFVAGREVFIPIQCEYYALEGLSQLLKTIDLIRSHLNPELRVSSILLTMYDGRTNLAQQVAGEVRSHFPAETFKTTIPRSVRISEAPSYGQTVMTYDATSTGALAYLQASRELAERGQGGSSPRRAMQAEPVGAQD